jgi:hypothetical protein
MFPEDDIDEVADARRALGRRDATPVPLLSKANTA